MSGSGGRLLNRLVERRATSNPYVAVTAFVARNPRGAFMLIGSVAAVGGVAMLIALSSIQAFLMISQQSSTNRQSRLSLVLDRPEGEEAGSEFALGGSGPGAPAVAGPLPTEPVGAEDIESVYGIRVHRSIAANIRALIDAAEADGIVLSGWGWRDNATQIRLRRQHCGTSEYAIYRMPSSQCRPPTARPGRSQHERGLAIDFTYNGQSISTQRSPGFRWLNANAANYGLRNLASEPWHWSTTGR